MSLKKILIIDDVITAGTAIKETIDLVTENNGIVVGVVVAIDRQEKKEDSYMSDIIIQTYQIPIISICKLKDISNHM